MRVDIHQPGREVQPGNIDQLRSLARRNVSLDYCNAVFSNRDITQRIHVVHRIDDVPALKKKVVGLALCRNAAHHDKRCDESTKPQ